MTKVEPAIMAYDEGIIPNPERMMTVGDEAGLEVIYEIERLLLHEAFTRARDRLLVSGIDPGLEFLDDIG